MTDKEFNSLGDLLKHPVVQKATDNINLELVERREYIPPACDVFSHAYTFLKKDDRYKFEIDKEAKNELPGIIDNAVQIVEGVDDPDESFREKYCKKRNIGIVFSG